ncbi:MAG: leucine-rich repeat protein [Paludibacteraceae bacterium]|nr:leucine-rich repeat protein [Paludibacteraceae bacterium]
MKKLVTSLLLISNVVGLWAYDFVSDGLYYDIIDQEEHIVAVTYQTSYWANNYLGRTDVCIPSSVCYNDTCYSVTTIECCAFAGCRTLKSIVLSCGLERVKARAFNRCTNLRTIICETLEPPILEYPTFEGVKLTKVKLYVPEGYINGYKNILNHYDIPDREALEEGCISQEDYNELLIDYLGASQWQAFKQVLPIETLPIE